MGWPYHIIELSDADRQARRESLDLHAAVAQLSTLVPVAAVLLVRLATWLVRGPASQRVNYDAVPTSPTIKHHRQTQAGSWAITARRLAWWLGEDVRFAGRRWGPVDQLLFGSLWAVWLLVLCFVNTGGDYNHLSKRFAAIAASQFPVQYLLSLKWLNPYAYVFRSSHEEVNRWHRVLGRIIYMLLIAHGVLYFNKWVQTHDVLEALRSRVGILGILGLVSMSLLNTTALAAVRHYSYRIFFITHIVVAIALPPVIFFHVHHARLFMMEALGVILLDIAVRKFDTVTAPASVEVIHGTSLIKIIAELPPATIAKYRDSPGSHVYMNIPASSRPPATLSSLVFDFTFSPFTVAAVSEDTQELTLVARQHGGPMTQNLGRLARICAGQSRVALCIEGPYGASKHFPNFVGADFDRVLLFAGGVGATFIMPLYENMMKENPLARVDMYWTVREAGEATWPVTGMGKEKSVVDDERIHLFLTGDILDSVHEPASSSEAAGALEMEALYKDGHNGKRPDIRRIVDDAFRQGHEERIAVLVCGPEGFGLEVRRHVGEWVHKGREVWYHNESFSW